MIQYNKHLQKILNKTIIHYKICSRKYIIFESSTKGKIYDAYNNELLFEGEFLNRKKNGKRI